MASNTYAKAYRTDPRVQKNEEFAFISYMEEPNSFSVVSVKRLIDVDQFRKGFIREKNKNYRITVERIGTLVDMEQLAKETEELSTYTMNADIVSDTEEWLKRKKSVINKNQDQTNVLNKNLVELHSFDLDENRTYTTLTTSSFDELDKAVDVSRVSSDDDDDDDDDDENCDELQGKNKIIGYQHSITPLNREPATKSKKRKLSTISRRSSAKRLRPHDISTPTANQDTPDVNQSSYSILKELNHNFIHLRKQIGGLIQLYDHHKQTLELILHNQKKMVKAMRHHQIPIILSDDTGIQTSTNTTNGGSCVYKFSTGEELDLIQIPADRTKPNKFVLNAIDKIFKDEQELLDIDPRCLNTDKRITIIQDAVQIKFGLTCDELATVWIPMLECIKSKRRNIKAKHRKSTLISDIKDLSGCSENQLTQSNSSIVDFEKQSTQLISLIPQNMNIPEFEQKRTGDSWDTQRYGKIICYETLPCPSSPLCLDWRDICDGAQEFLNGADEENCDKLEFNECEDDEFRCTNGMCIPEEFWLDGDHDCMDWSDEYYSEHEQTCPFYPKAMECDEHLCVSYMYSCGDGECVYWETRVAFQRVVEAREDCFNKRNLNYMCAVSPRRSAWTLESGLCCPDKDYDDLRYPE
ncbi:unnamed protein product [Rotaria socialis]|uniref:Uncharacterized protein n=2 Tax=Rotaria socialis TaxID=392032 RepID=A0A820VVU6_9BILA|nr:unnamed protein product [Rotaria socialis]